MMGGEIQPSNTRRIASTRPATVAATQGPRQAHHGGPARPPDPWAPITRRGLRCGR
jgi:hypothetical protein